MCCVYKIQIYLVHTQFEKKYVRRNPILSFFFLSFLHNIAFCKILKTVPACDCILNRFVLFENVENASRKTLLHHYHHNIRYGIEYFVSVCSNENHFLHLKYFLRHKNTIITHKNSEMNEMKKEKIRKHA